MKNTKKSRYYIIGGGIAGLSTAVYLIQDAKIEGGQITIFEKAKRVGGALDAKESKQEDGYTMRGIRVFEDTAYTCTMDLMEKIPLKKGKTIESKFLKFNNENGVYFEGRLMKNKEIINSKKLQISLGDRLKLIKLLFISEKVINDKKIEDYFSKSFFKSIFWYEFCTVFAFMPWHSLKEMKRYLLRSIHCSQYFNTLEPLKITPLNQYEFLIIPIVEYLKDKKVHFSIETKITNVVFKKENEKKKIIEIDLLKDEKDEKILVGKDDKVFISIGSMVANSSVGDMNTPPEKKLDKKSLSWELWENISKENPEYGNPKAFISDIPKIEWTSFTITFKESLIKHLLKKFVHNQKTAFTGTTIVDSNWFISVGFHLEKYFKNQKKDTLITWGYALNPNAKGNYVKKKIVDCSGKEILKEIVYQLGWEQYEEEILKTSVCIPCYTPYVSSQFMPTKAGDRADIVPKNAINFAFIGQFVEIPDDIVFTVEYSIRSAQIAVYNLLKLSKKLIPIYKGQYKPKVIWNTIKAFCK